MVCSHLTPALRSSPTRRLPWTVDSFAPDTLAVAFAVGVLAGVIRGITGSVGAMVRLCGIAWVVAKEGAPHRIRANAICSGFVRTPLVEREIS